MTNVSTLMALAVISLVASIGFAYAETVGDGTSEVHVYDFPFDVTVVEGGSIVVHNDSITPYSIEHTGTIGTDKSGTFSFNVNAGTTVEQSFPVEDCSSCYYAGTYYWKDTINGVTGSITIIHPEGWQPPVQEEVGITESVVVVLSGDSTSTITPEPTPIETSGIVVEMTENGFSQTSLFIEDGDSVTFVNTHVKANGNIEPHAISDPFAVPYTELSYWILANSEVSHTYTLDCDGYTFYDRFFDVPSITIECGYGRELQTTIPTPIEPEPPITVTTKFTSSTEMGGKYDVAEWTGTYDTVSLQEQLVEITTKFNKAVENLGHEQNKSEQLQNKVNEITTSYHSLTTSNGLTNEEFKKMESERDTLKLEITDLEDKLESRPDNTQQIAEYKSSVETLEDKVSLLEQQKAEITIEKNKWKTLSDNWYAVAIQQLQVMVNVLGL